MHEKGTKNQKERKTGFNPRRAFLRANKGAPRDLAEKWGEISGDEKKPGGKRLVLAEEYERKKDGEWDARYIEIQ